jgi:hypothetical protein
MHDSPYNVLIDFREPVDYLEPETTSNETREAGLAFIRIISLAVAFILESKDKTAAAYGVAFALGLSSITDRSMREIGRELNLSSGTLSVYAKNFRRVAGLPPSLLQMDLDKADKCRENRNNQLHG